MLVAIIRSLAFTPLIALVIPSTCHGEEKSRAHALLAKLHDNDDSTVMVAAHRGDWRNAPENSLRAIDNAIRMGVDVIEIDIRMTKDRQLVVLHDKTLERTTTGAGKVTHHTLDQLRQLRLKNGYGVATKHGIPTLKEALELTRGRALVYLDKSEEMILQAYELVAEMDMADEVLFYGHRNQQALREELGVVAEKIHYLPKLGESTRNPKSYLEGFGNHAPAFVTSFSDENSTVLEMFPRIQSQGSRIWASSLWNEICAGRTDDVAVEDPDAAWGWLIEQGASVLCTDRPRDLLTYLRARGLHE